MFLSSVGQEAEVTDAHKALGQDVKHKVLLALDATLADELQLEIERTR